MVKLLDCTIRDGGIVNDFDFNIEFVENTLEIIDKSNIDFFEIGYVHTNKYLNSSDGIWKNVPFNIVLNIKEKYNPKCLFSTCVDFGKFELEQFQKSSKTGIDLIRVVGLYEDMGGILEILPNLKEKGYLVSINLMATSHCSIDNLKNLVKMINSSTIKPDFFYIADSFGALFPSDIKRIFNIINKLDKIKLGFHGHNNLQLAFANSLEAIENGAYIIDGTLYGMGKCAGNLPIEKMVSYLKYHHKYDYDEKPLLNYIKNDMVEIIKKYEWGYKLKYMITGILNATPRYGQRYIENGKKINEISEKLVTLSLTEKRKYTKEK